MDKNFTDSKCQPVLVEVIDLNDPKVQEDQERKYHEWIKKHYNVK